MLPVLGTIKTHESTRKLHRRIAGGTAKVNSATVRREAGRWFVPFTVEIQRTERSPARPRVIGVDRAITTLALLGPDTAVGQPWVHTIP
jgi:putative transposase